MKWDDFIKGIVDDAGTLAKNELVDLITNAATDGEAFIQKQGQKMKRYIQQLADGEITKDEFQGYMVDLQDLMRMEALKMSVVAKARAQRIADGIQSMIIDRLLKLIP
jgi:predicted YcjX-like family ATPase